jgi:hypothetical protein
LLIKGSTLPPLILSRGHWARASVVCLAVLLTEISIPAPAVATQEYADIHESLTDAWWTGPILAASASTLPQGHILVEPYLYDSIDDGHLDQNGKRTATPRAQTLGSLTYLIYGLTDKVSIGMIPRFNFSEAPGIYRSSALELGDWSFQGQYRLTQFSEESRIPTVSVLMMETVPTGKYDRLDGKPGDGFGSGAYTTTLALYSQDYFWMPNERILRVRVNSSYAWSEKVNVEGVSVYATPSGFRGNANPGQSFVLNASAEYSASQNWVFAMDVWYEHDRSTTVDGALAAFSAPATNYASKLGPSEYIAFAPAVEFNWTSTVGVIIGARIVEFGRNVTATITPVAAINLVF